uniref:Uncharacterized protein n=1 Tax=Parascaris univalens TaxID=6257 RepID=A0A914ZJP3_PARUN
MPWDLTRRTPSQSPKPPQNSLTLPAFQGKSVSTVDLRIEKFGFDSINAHVSGDDDSVLTRCGKNVGKYLSANDLRYIPLGGVCLSSTDKFLMDRNYMGNPQRIQISGHTGSLSPSPPPTK